MSSEKSPEHMTAYERWELPNLGDERSIASLAQGKPVQRSVKPLTADDLEQIREQAYQDGLRQGLDEGRRKGLELGKTKGIELGKKEGLEKARVSSEKQLLETKQQLEKLVLELLQPIQTQQQQYEQVMLNISLALARAVIYQELQTNSSVIENALQQAVESLPSSAAQVCVRLNPADFKHVNEIVKAQGLDARILADGNIMRGGCLVESTEHIVDFTVEKRFQKVVQGMLVAAAQTNSDALPMESPQSLQSHTEYPRALLDEALPEPPADDSTSEPEGD